MSSNGRVSSQRLELLIVGRVLLTVGVASLTVGAAITAALFDQIGAGTRTIGGLILAALMVGLGELLSRRNQSSRLKFWLSTNLMSAGYALAYFFLYSLFYVPGLTVLETPYLSWFAGLGLAAIATFHGSRNPAMRWVTPVFTVLATGHASFHALTSDLVVNFGAVSIKVAAIGSFVGMVWCAGLSAVYKRLQNRYKWPADTFEEGANWLFNRVAHEAYFIAAALNAMALPLFLSDFSQAPLWWSLEAPILLALSWRNGNFFKHGVVGLIWAAAVFTLLRQALGHAVDLPVLFSVPVSGLAIGLAYRYVTSRMTDKLKLTGYCLYTYGSVLVALVVPYVMTATIWDAMPYWMIQALVISGIGLALRDRLVHNAGFITGMGSLVLFGLQYSTWTWGLVGPVVTCAYALSVAYSYISNKGGWKQADFFPEDVFPWTHTVTESQARRLESLWSWAGTAVLLGASLFLNNHQEAVLWWSVEAFVLMVLSVVARSERYRHQSVIAFGLAGVKLAIWDLSGGNLGFTTDAMFTMFRSLEFTVFGASSLLASFLCFYEERRLEAAQNAAASGNNGGGTTPGGGPGTGTGNGGSGEGEEGSNS